MTGGVEGSSEVPTHTCSVLHRTSPQSGPSQPAPFKSAESDLPFPPPKSGPLQTNPASLWHEFGTDPANSWSRDCVG